MILVSCSDLFPGSRRFLRSSQVLRSLTILRSGSLLRSLPDLLSGMWPVYENCLKSIPERLPPLSLNVAGELLTLNLPLCSHQLSCTCFAIFFCHETLLEYNAFIDAAKKDRGFFPQADISESTIDVEGVHVVFQRWYHNKPWGLRSKKINRGVTMSVKAVPPVFGLRAVNTYFSAQPLPFPQDPTRRSAWLLVQERGSGYLHNPMHCGWNRKNWTPHGRIHSQLFDRIRTREDK